MSKPVATPWHWQFPPAEHPLPLGNQIRCVAFSVREASAAYVDGADSEKVAEHLMRAIHHAETALRAIERGFVDLDGAKRGVIARNAEIGWYGEGDAE